MTRTRRRWAPLLAAGALVIGLTLPGTARGAEAELKFRPPVQAIGGDCGGTCFEPTIAVDNKGRIFVTTVEGQVLSRSEDGGRSFQPVHVPPLPAPAPGFSGVGRGDSTVWAAPDGSLYFTALDSDFGSTGTAATVPEPLCPSPDVPSCAVNYFYYAVAGVEVARSDDAGASWAFDSVIRFDQTQPPTTLGADREWLAFGAGKTVYLSFQQAQPSLNVDPTQATKVIGADDLVVMRSDDGGRSFPVSTVVSPPALGNRGGPISVPADGTVLLPFLQGSATAYATGITPVRVAISNDRGSSFHFSDLNGSNGGSWPVISVAPDQTWWLTWWDANQTVLVSHSRDRGATWSPPVSWGPPGATDQTAQIGTCPWIAAPATGNVDVMAYRDTSSSKPASSEVFFERAPTWRAGSGPVSTIRLAQGIRRTSGYSSSCNSDFSILAYTPRGQAAAVWADAKSVYVAIESPTAAGPARTGAGAPPSTVPALPATGGASNLGIGAAALTLALGVRRIRAV